MQFWELSEVFSASPCWSCPGSHLDMLGASGVLGIGVARKGWWSQGKACAASPSTGELCAHPASLQLRVQEENVHGHPTTPFPRKQIFPCSLSLNGSHSHFPWAAISREELPRILCWAHPMEQRWSRASGSRGQCWKKTDGKLFSLDYLLWGCW